MNNAVNAIKAINPNIILADYTHVEAILETGANADVHDRYPLEPHGQHACAALRAIGRTRDGGRPIHPHPAACGGGASCAFARYVLGGVLMDDGYVEFHTTDQAATQPWPAARWMQAGFILFIARIYH